MKHEEQTLSTHLGRLMQNSDEQRANVSGSIRRSFDFDSGVTSRRESEERKHLEQRTATHLGMQIEASDEQPRNALVSIRSMLASD